MPIIETIKVASHNCFRTVVDTTKSPFFKPMLKKAAVTVAVTIVATLVAEAIAKAIDVPAED